MKLTKRQLADLSRWATKERVRASFSAPLSDRPLWTWQEIGIMRDLIRLARVGFASREAFPVSAESQDKSRDGKVRRYREANRKGWATRKRLADARAAANQEGKAA